MARNHGEAPTIGLVPTGFDLPYGLLLLLWQIGMQHVYTVPYRGSNPLGSTMVGVVIALRKWDDLGA